jgi:hypothetical protein
MPQFKPHALIWVITTSALIFPPISWSQDAKAEYDLTWKIRHDQAAFFEVYDLQGVQQNDSSVLGCEILTRFPATHEPDIPWRYLLAQHGAACRVGAQWQTKEFAFADVMMGLGVGPIQIIASYRLRAVKKVRIEEILRASSRARKTKSEPVEIAFIESQCDVFRCSWNNGVAAPAEKKPSAAFSVLTLIRVSDGAIVGGRYQWNGRMQRYKGISGEPPVAPSQEGYEVVLKEPLVELKVGALKEPIDKAVEMGIRWLKTRQNKDSTFGDGGGYEGKCKSGIGSTSLSLMAMLHSGVRTDDPSIRGAFEAIQSKRSDETYDLALELMALETKYLPQQFLSDVETYSEEGARKALAKVVSKEDKAFATQLSRAILDHQGSHGGFSYKDGTVGDLSNTVYAVLGLKAASRLGVTIPGNVWINAIGFVERAGTPTGKEVKVQVTYFNGEKEERVSKEIGWGYRIGGRAGVGNWENTPTGSMTSAALVASAVSRSELVRAGEWTDSLDSRAKDLEWGGLGWLQNRFQMRASTPEGCWVSASLTYYYLFGMERLGILEGIRCLGEHDWYLEGAAILLASQQVDGHWEGPYAIPIIDTDFALLFLKRAILPVETLSRKGPGPKDTATSGNAKKNSEPGDKPERTEEGPSKDK